MGVTAFPATFTGPLASKYGSKTMLLIGLSLMSISCILFPFGDSRQRYWPIVFPALVIGSAGCAMIFTHAKYVHYLC